MGKMTLGILSDELSVKQLRFLTSYISTGSVTKSCKKLRVSRHTAYSWFENPVFLNTYRKKRDEVFDKVFSSLLILAEEAVEALRQTLTSQNDSIKLKSAEAILDRALRLRESQNLAGKLETLERIISENVLTPRKEPPVLNPAEEPADRGNIIDITSLQGGDNE